MNLRVYPEGRNTDFGFLRAKCCSKRDDITRGWRTIELHNEELHVLTFSPSTVRIIKSSGMRCGGYLERRIIRKVEVKGKVVPVL
jgi:hypothetical protein